MPNKIAITEVKNFEDPKVAAIIENLRELRCKLKEDAKQGLSDEDFDKRIIYYDDDPLSLILVIAVQNELGLSDQQKAAIKKQMLVDYMEDIRKALANSWTGGEPEMLEMSVETYQRNRKRLNDSFAPEQQRRMQEIVLQHEGARGLRRKDVAAKLSLTDEQKRKIEAIFERSGRRLTQQEAIRQAMDILTPDQLDAFEKLKGKPVAFNIMLIDTGKLETIYQ